MVSAGGARQQLRTDADLRSAEAAGDVGVEGQVGRGPDLVGGILVSAISRATLSRTGPGGAGESGGLSDSA